ncbi:hypothetical protein HO133_009434 [Letharia lupina]|uniref:Uncharacterized protein n=1 Tax=Letharia lupina TaxID=560253 RepID=A0A8H6CN95_9LECA|nr:uncharacterized protein HO133_009434 [Letharia lupina]KAF6226568.1 hypothetical protein HO133_009434 [Letharia lupina]
MRLTFACLASLLASAVAAPVEKRVNTLPPVDSATDESVLQLALYLEHLELALYTGGYENFTDAEYTAAGFPAGFRENVGVIASHEATHSATISAILEKAGYTPVPTCSYKFPYDSPTSFVDLANMITSVGIGAYLGGAELLTDDPMLEVASASILTVEARHDSYLRAGVGASPFPTSFDTALTAVFAYNLAQMFIVECPQQLPLPILPKLTLESPMPPSNLQPPTPAGTLLKFIYDPSTFFVEVAPGTPLYIGLINMVTNVTYTEVTSCGTGCATIPVPEGAAGAAFAVLTTFPTADALTEDQLSSFGTLAGPAEVILS